MTSKKERPKRSPIWLMPEEQFIELVKSSETYVAILRYFGFTANGGNNFQTVKARIQALNIDDSHMLTHGKQIVFAHKKNRRDNKEVLVKGYKRVNGVNIKKRLLALGVRNVCDICGQLPTWNGKPLCLQVDHIDGSGTNNELSNLRLVCPNCHTQTETFAGKKLRLPKNICAGCGKAIDLMSSRCVTCHVAYIVTHELRVQTAWPSSEDLQALVNSLGYSETGRRFGVSDNAVRRRLKRQKIVVQYKSSSGLV